MDASHYSANTSLRDGRAVLVRAQRPSDREGMRTVLTGLDEESIRRRFFGPRRSFSEAEVAFFLDIDFVRQVSLVVLADGSIVAGGRYIVTEPGVAEVAFAVAEHWQGLGLGSLLMQHLVLVARDQGLRRFEADVLTENSPMLAVFRKCGLPAVSRHAGGEVHLTMDLHEARP